MDVSREGISNGIWGDIWGGWGEDGMGAKRRLFLLLINHSWDGQGENFWRMGWIGDGELFLIPVLCVHSAWALAFEKVPLLGGLRHGASWYVEDALIIPPG